MIPDAEKILTAHLAAELADLGARVVGRTPGSTEEPWVRLTQLDAKTVDGSRSDHLIEFYLQADCYAGLDGGQSEASTVARRARDAFVAAPAATHTGATVTGAEINSGPARMPDTDFEPARERYTLTATIWAYS
jgi:hypothetical protein